MKVVLRPPGHNFRLAEDKIFSHDKDVNVISFDNYVNTV